MRKHYNLFYIFQDDKAQSKLSREKSVIIWKTIEKRFPALASRRAELADNTKVNGTGEEKQW